MSIKVLMLGDVYGRVGRGMLKKYLAEIKRQKEIDLTIVNVENASNTRGITLRHYEELNKLGIDVMTSGDHVFAFPETLEFIEWKKNLLRPLNASPFLPGTGRVTLTVKGKNVGVTNLLGTTFMPYPGNNPYYYFERESLSKRCEIEIVDFHAEATGEKRAFALYYEGQITAFVGTHTHVQTADEEITQNGTAYITDLGLTGPINGSIGADLKAVWRRARLGIASKLISAEGRGKLEGVIITINETTNKAETIERISFKEQDQFA